jgi:cellulose synthase/poly-beta-1,6-N-acetylglucosamine synthase-like glycosyltransferase
MFIQTIFFALSLILTLLFFLYGFNQYFLLRAARKYQAPGLPETPGNRPSVSIQLPVYNERYVVGRLVAASAAMAEAYGKDHTRILLLDDSDDDTVLAVEKAVAEYQDRGFWIEVLRRESRDGFKAGALEAALERTAEDYIAIFDADFLPPEDFLCRSLPYFDQDECLGIVQGRWAHLNRNYSLLTRAISHAIDVHFLVEQPGRYAAGIFQNFNGSGGVLRKKAVLEAGGWQADTLAEDLDLSYRMQMLGYRVLYLRDLLCPGEIPPTVPNFKLQQGRWASGTIKTALKILPKLLFNRAYGLKQRLQSIIHLTGYMIQPLMVISFMLACAAALLGSEPSHTSRVNGLLGVSSALAAGRITLTSTQNLTWLILVPFIALCALAPWISLAFTIRSQDLSFLPSLASLLVLLLLCFGITLSTMRGVGRALFTNRPGYWARTPKYAELQNQRGWKQSRYQIPLDLLWIWELAFVVVGMGSIRAAVRYSDFSLLLILVPFTASYAFVLLFSVLQSRKSRA